ncbi:MAG: 4Fe-4S dicluster domain-containing protein [Chloroflexi bacterium]|nr:4Fe-4S dicluster domain-containing protein [Chloroflexota bacterium]
MKGKVLTLDQLLGLDKYVIDEQGHIKVNQALCASCELKPCLTVCPAGVYSLVEDRIIANHENCLECGTCIIACNVGGRTCIEWKNPRGSYGISFRYG